MCSMFGMRTRTSECEHRTFWRLKNGPKIPILAIYFHIYPINFKKYFSKDYRIAHFFIFQIEKIFSIFIFCNRLKKWAKMGKIGSFCLLKNAWDVCKSSSNIDCELWTSRTCVRQPKVEHRTLRTPQNSANIEHCSFQH